MFRFFFGARKLTLFVFFVSPGLVLLFQIGLSFKAFVTLWPEDESSLVQARPRDHQARGPGLFG